MTNLGVGEIMEHVPEDRRCMPCLLASCLLMLVLGCVVSASGRLLLTSHCFFFLQNFGSRNGCVRGGLTWGLCMCGICWSRTAPAGTYYVQEARSYSWSNCTELQFLS